MGDESLFKVLVADSGCIYKQDVEGICCPKEPQSTEPHTQQDTDSNGHLFDPLFNPPAVEAVKPWLSSVMILVPTRLGLEAVDKSYTDMLLKVFQCKQCVGVIGGKRAHSVYFIGAQGQDLHLLDPHTTQVRR